MAITQKGLDILRINGQLPELEQIQVLVSCCRVSLAEIEERNLTDALARKA